MVMKELVKQCCRCHKVLLKGKWRRNIVSRTDVHYSHGLCPDCFAEDMAKLDKLYPESTGVYE